MGFLYKHAILTLYFYHLHGTYIMDEGTGRVVGVKNVQQPMEV